jgi:hypothetical protein
VARKAFHRKGAKKSRKERKENLADFPGSLCRGLLTARLFLVLPVGSAGSSVLTLSFFYGDHSSTAIRFSA